MRRHTKPMLIAALLAVCANPVYAKKTVGGYGACISEDLFNQFIDALVNEDDRARDYLLNNGCIVTKGGLDVTVLDTTWTGTAKVRVYVGGDAIVLWTNIENIE